MRWLMTVFLCCAFVSVEAETFDRPRATEVSEIIASILQIHPEGRRLEADAAFTRAGADLLSSADDLGLAQYIMRLHHLFSLVGDGHTAVLSTDLQQEPFTLRTPILVQPFADGLYVIQAKDEATALLGGRVVSLNDTTSVSPDYDRDSSKFTGTIDKVTITLK